jgi:hypothetical protein
VKRENSQGAGCVVFLVYAAIGLLVYHTAYQSGAGVVDAVIAGLCWPFVMAEMVGQFVPDWFAAGRG